MSTETKWLERFEELESGVCAIGLVVWRRKLYWVFSGLGYFFMDTSGIPSDPKLERLNLPPFRGGINALDEDAIEAFLALDDVEVFSTDELRRVLLLGCEEIAPAALKALEERYSFDLPVSEALWDGCWRIQCRLPKFYINYHTKEFRHIDSRHHHESMALEGWTAAGDSDFGMLVPNSHRYWVRDGISYWLMTVPDFK